MKKKFKIFLYGLDYGIKNFGNSNDAAFHTWSSREEDNILYRKAIKIGKTYGFYRIEFLAMFVLFFTLLIFILTW